MVRTMTDIKDFTYDALMLGKERERYYSFAPKIEKIRNGVIEDARLKVFYEMDHETGEKVTRRASEKAMFYYVSTGDIVKISEIIAHADANQRYGDISENARMQALSILISAVTLFTRAAVDGGLPETIAYSLSDAFIHSALSMERADEIMTLASCALYDFTFEVNRYRYRDCTQLVRKCCEYISRHLHDEITLKTLTEYTGKTANYISDSFYKDLKVRPTVYIRKLKLDYAKNILEVAELSVAAVSDLLAFPSTSAFITYFKEEFGVTPLQYRKNLE